MLNTVNAMHKMQNGIRVLIKGEILARLWLGLVEKNVFGRKNTLAKFKLKALRKNRTGGK